jgi:hypothetical protein
LPPLQIAQPLQDCLRHGSGAAGIHIHIENQPFGRRGQEAVGDPVHHLNVMDFFGVETDQLGAKFQKVALMDFALIGDVRLDRKG